MSYHSAMLRCCARRGCGALFTHHDPAVTQCAEHRRAAWPECGHAREKVQDHCPWPGCHAKWEAAQAVRQGEGERRTVVQLKRGAKP